MTEPKEHCEHERICYIFRKGSIVALYDGTPCMRNHEGCKTCEYDTRPHPAQPAQQRIDVLTEVREELLSSDEIRGDCMRDAMRVVDALLREGERG